jgi:alpha-ketoglutarate-dependent taurine dioxygenase
MAVGARSETPSRGASGPRPAAVELLSGAAGAPDLARWLLDRAQWIEGELLDRGAFALRGCSIHSAAEFAALLEAMGVRLLDYVLGNSPRTKLSGNVYTSTEYPSPLPISVHNELSYAARWPARLYFLCLEPASRGGETPLADCRSIVERLDPAVLRRFERKGVRYVQNLHAGNGLGRSWQSTFETTSRRRVESVCRRHGVAFAWSADGDLRLTQTRPAVAVHPGTGAKVWFNQAEQWHPSSLDAETEELLRETLSPDEYPLNAFFGDGSPIAAADLAHVRDVARECSAPFAWRAGDLLILDNLLLAHGRAPFSGTRTVLVAMGDEPSSSRESI